MACAAGARSLMLAGAADAAPPPARSLMLPRNLFLSVKPAAGFATK